MKNIGNELLSKIHLVAVLAALVLGLGLGYALRDGGSEAKQLAGREHATVETIENAAQENPTPEQSEAKANAVYVCPMNCVPPMEQPGKCPVCGMDLVPVSTHEHRDETTGSRLQFSAEKAEAAGIQVAHVEEKFVTSEIRLYGKIEYDPVEQYKVTAFAPGVVDNIYVRRAGQVVRKGDPLFDLHSSDLFFLEQELFETLKKLPYELDLRPAKGHSRKRVGRWTRLLLPKKKPGSDTKLGEEEAKAVMQGLDRIQRKMRLLGLSEKDVEGLIVKGRPTGIATVTTPMTGIVLEQNAFRGTFVNTGDVVFTIANPRVLWARLDAYASDFPWIRLGQEAEFETDAYPGQTFKGKVVYIDPEFDPESRVFKVGVLYRDTKGLLKPNMLVRCVIHAKMTSGGAGVAETVTRGMMGTAQMRRTDTAPLVIPETAPLITGKRAIVYVAVPGKPGTYEGREVVLGPRGQGYYIVRKGLKKDEMVVVNGNFKIDSAVQILAKSSMMEQKGGELPADHYQHVESHPMEVPAKTKQPRKGAQYRFFTGHESNR